MVVGPLQILDKNLTSLVDIQRLKHWKAVECIQPYWVTQEGNRMEWGGINSCVYEIRRPAFLID